ncbi:unnamed protein product [Paramecium sonneborni]|uniref:RRM domain-containing protein n=1 Tax=Paramecium sonneborni TaxID=65129 RepID=A0A8S1PXZ0_9CILI|nr:unnamed protein product [Paramecium sonneborni]
MDIIQQILENFKEDQEITITDNTCTKCQQFCKTKVSIKKVPNFQHIFITSFNCPSCGYINDEVKFKNEKKEKGIKLQLKIDHPQQLQRRIIRSQQCKVTIPELEFNIQTTKRSSINTLEGFLQISINELAREQNERKNCQGQLYSNIQFIIENLQQYKLGKRLPFHWIMDDPSGNSFIMDLNESPQDQTLNIQYYTREDEQFETIFKKKQNTKEEDFILKDESKPKQQQQQLLLQQQQQFYLKIRGLPFQCTKQDLLNFLEMPRLKKENLMMKFQQNGFFTGEAYIQLNSIGDLDYLRTFHKSQMDHRYLEIFNSNFDEFEKALQSNQFLKQINPKIQSELGNLNEENEYQCKQQGVLKLRGLPWTSTEKDVLNFFQNNSKIKQVKLLYDDSGKAKGQCFVVVKNLETAEKLKKKYHRKLIGTRYIEVFICSQREYLACFQQNKSDRKRSISP